LLLSIFFFTLLLLLLLLLFRRSNEPSRDGCEETIRDRAPKFTQNVDLMYTMCRKEFGDLDLDSLRMTLTTSSQL